MVANETRTRGSLFREEVPTHLLQFVSEKSLHAISKFRKRVSFVLVFFVYSEWRSTCNDFAETTSCVNWPLTRAHKQYWKQQNRQAKKKWSRSLLWGGRFSERFWLLGDWEHFGVLVRWSHGSCGRTWGWTVVMQCFLLLYREYPTIDLNVLRIKLCMCKLRKIKLLLGYSTVCHSKLLHNYNPGQKPLGQWCSICKSL